MAQAPTIVSTFPTQNALNVPLDTTISVTFGVDMNPAIINATTFVVHGGYTGRLSGAYTYDSGTKTATFTPAQPFRVGEQVSVTVTTGVIGAGGARLEYYLAWIFRVGVEGGSGILAIPHRYDDLPNPASMVAADLDGDGDVDFAVGHFLSNVVTVLKNGGEGNIIEMEFLGAGGFELEAITAVDLNGDGRVDLATTNASDNNVSVFLAKTGSPSFWIPDQYSVGRTPRDIIGIDVDGDGDIDLVVVNDEDYNLSLLRNNGDGTFQTAETIFLGVILSYGVLVTAADFDTDGDIDLAVTMQGSNTMGVLLNRGNGTFENPISYDLADPVQAVIAFDINGDGYTDLAFANASTSNNISILLNLGTGTFTAATKYTVGSNPVSLTHGDLDGDGDDELIIANYDDGTITVLQNNSDGSFELAATYFVGPNPIEVIAIDLDDDGDIDIATMNQGDGQLAVLMNRNINATIEFSADTLSFGSTKISSTDSTIFIIYNEGLDSSLQVTSINSASLAFSASPATFIVPPNDSINVVVTFSPDAILEYRDSLNIISNDPRQTLVKIPITGWGNPILDHHPPSNSISVSLETTISVAFGLAMAGSTFNANSFVVQGNFTGIVSGGYSYDVDSKVIVFTPSKPFRLGEIISVSLTTAIKSAVMDTLWRPSAWDFRAGMPNGSGQFAAATDYVVGSVPSYIIAADFNMDEKIDLAVSHGNNADISILLNVGSAIFDNVVKYQIGSGQGGIVAADLNGNGLIDLAALYLNHVSVLLNNNGTGFIIDRAYFVGGNPADLVAADFNGDGVTDLATVNPLSNSLSVLLNSGGGIFPDLVNYPVGADPYSIFAADLNGDGSIDLATSNSGSDNVAVLMNNGKGGFGSPSYYSAGDTPSSITGADLDGDGNVDLIVTNFGDNSLSVFKNLGNGRFAAAAVFDVNSPLDVKTVDVDGDGDIDLAVTNPSGNRVYILLNDGMGNFPFRTFYDTGADPLSIATADFDRDGDIDLVVTNNLSGNISVLLNLDAFSARLALDVRTEHSDTLSITYIISNPNGYPTSLLVEHSIDGGSSWTILPSIIGDTTDLMPASYQGTFQWDSYADHPGEDLPAVQLRIIPYDQTGQGLSYATAPFHLDNNRIPTATLIPLAAVEYKGDIVIDYQLFDLENDTLNIAVEYLDTDQAIWQSASLTGTTAFIVSENYTGQITWQTAIDLPEGIGYYSLRITPFDNDEGVSDTSIILLDQLGVAITIGISQFDTEQSGDIEVGYTLQDDESDTLGILAEFSIDSGETWGQSSISGATSGIVPSNYSGTLTWHSESDLPGVDATTVRFRIIPMDAHVGISLETADFHLDNNLPPSIATGSHADTITTYMDIPYLLSDAEFDTLTILGEYSLDQGQSWFMPTLVDALSEVPAAQYA
ncbi:MAG: VCBS repeat-containing protein, partial [Candidatus Marinimicrobia bacterium]|nr:VCBS repeat-containing protein [Candidatus Neomarinimicrobiota bacterium]